MLGRGELADCIVMIGEYHVISEYEPRGCPRRRIVECCLYCCRTPVRPSGLGVWPLGPALTGWLVRSHSRSHGMACTDSMIRQASRQNAATEKKQLPKIDLSTVTLCHSRSQVKTELKPSCSFVRQPPPPIPHLLIRRVLAPLECGFSIKPWRSAISRFHCAPGRSFIEIGAVLQIRQCNDPSDR